MPHAQLQWRGYIQWPLGLTIREMETGSWPWGLEWHRTTCGFNTVSVLMRWGTGKLPSITKIPDGSGTWTNDHFGISLPDGRLYAIVSIETRNFKDFRATILRKSSTVKCGSWWIRFRLCQQITSGCKIAHSDERSQCQKRGPLKSLSWPFQSLRNF